MTRELRRRLRLAEIEASVKKSKNGEILFAGLILFIIFGTFWLANKIDPKGVDALDTNWGLLIFGICWVFFTLEAQILVLRWRILDLEDEKDEERCKDEPI